MYLTFEECYPDRFEDYIKSNEKLLFYFCNKWIKYNPEDSYDELYGMALFAFWKAWKSFDISKNINFTTYAGKIITNEFLIHNRNKEKAKRLKMVSLDFTIAEDSSGTKLKVLDLIEDKSVDILGEVYKGEEEAKLERFIKGLSPRERHICQLAMQGFNQVEIAEDLKISQACISRVKKRLLKKYDRMKV